MVREGTGKLEDDDNDDQEPNSTPKLSLFKLPNKQKDQFVLMQTPPLCRAASIPFQWEEAPGRPRASADALSDSAAASPPSKTKSTATARCLELPPRLQTNEAARVFNNSASPTTVLDGPYSAAATEAEPDGKQFPSGFSFRSLEEAIFGGAAPSCSRSKKWSGSRKQVLGKYGSWRWGSFKEDGGERSSRVHQVHSVVDHFSVASATASCASDQRDSHRDRRGKISAVRRLNSFFSFNQTSSNLWAGIRRRFKQAVPPETRNREPQKRSVG